MSTPDTPTELPSETPSRRFPRWLTWAIVGVIAIVVIGYGLIFLYAKVLNDSPDELGESDLDAALAVTTTTAQSTAPADTGSTETAPADDGAATTTAAPEPAAPAGAGRWVVTPDSELGYRVKEILFGVDTEGVGRTNQITGSLTIDGTTVTAADFTVDVASIESDDGRRDNQFRGRIMSASEFPTATFVLTEPIELGVEPADGAEVATSATGDLTLRGVTNSVTFDLTARQENGRIAVLGQIPVVFADYDIANPSTAGITTEDNGLLEFVLVFQPA